ncbi:phosphoribosylglycinamide formyltransferase [Rivibacter subsaxonicus]|uniref:Phosphoribosylglycinamide formyltransferase n=1 Tax=Rivibacter subsaxonicus TaxID=457575 RepID=A0A4Q7W0F7_9BURK|nr:phosphoribosylglycinamide formyltransferase [Rivibacter subsaxonicus]RZU02692.1 formyltetrahydrofolate-dependent phosphoribosylglycinamide formyltransferase [Rivibacter subsaxonicus]
MSEPVSALVPLPPRRRIAVLISGRGSNLEALVEAMAAERWDARIVAVIANRPDAAGLAWAAARGLPTAGLDHRAFAEREAFDAALAQAIDASGAELVVLAGFMRILSDGFVRRYEGRLVNIHPSLLPAFAGLHTHRRALEAGCAFAGATVHLVTPTLDHGPIIAQAVVPVRPDDTEAGLSARVLAAEHRLYPMALRWLIEGRLALDAQGRVRPLDGQPQGLFFES